MYLLEAGADKLQVVAETLAKAGLKSTGIFSYDCGRLFSEGIISDACGVVSDLVISKIGANKALDFVCNFTHCIPV